MRKLAPLIASLIALLSLLYASAQLVLLFAGDRVEAVVTRAETSEAETEMEHRRRSASKATGYFKIDIEVAYRFDVLPTATEALQRVSMAPLHKDVTGEDVLHYKVRSTDATPVSVGKPIRVIYLRRLPSWNRADQSSSLLNDSLLGLGLSTVLGLYAALQFRRNHQASRKSAA